MSSPLALSQAAQFPKPSLSHRRRLAPTCSAPVVAGMASMDYRRFVGYTVIGAVVWAVGVTWLGYFLGSLLGPDGGKYLEYIVAAIIIASIAPPVIHVLRERGKSNEVLTRP